MRFACVQIEHLPTRLEAALQPALSNQPLVVLRAWYEHVLDASPDVEASGIPPAIHAAARGLLLAVQRISPHLPVCTELSYERGR